MDKEYIELIGIAKPSQFPECHPHHPATQICQADKLVIGNTKCIKKILQVCVGIHITESRIICTPLGKKLVVEGIKQIKIVYISEDPCSVTKTACFYVPFALFILLKDIKEKVIKVCAAIEDISAKRLDGKSVLVTTIIFACPIFEKKHCEGVLTYKSYSVECECHDDTLNDSCYDYKNICYYEHANNETSNECGTMNDSSQDNEPCTLYGQKCYYGR